jgi:nucleotide-binding universal stress UspA family protein
VTIERILVLLDGSNLAEQAIPFAVAIARLTKAELILFRAAPSSQTAQAALGNALDEASDYLADIAARFQDSGVGLRALTSAAEPGEAIVSAINREAADMLAVTTHAPNGDQRLAWGPVVDRVLGETAVPVLLVPSVSIVSWPADQPIRLAVPLDGSVLAEQAIGPAAELARALGATLVLIRAVEPVTVPAGVYSTISENHLASITEERAAESRRYLGRIVRQLRSDGVLAEAEIRPGLAPTVIDTVVRDREALGIVMATHDEGGLRGLLLGSVANSVTRYAHVPVLLVRPWLLRGKAKPQRAVAPEALLLTQDELQLVDSALRHLANESAGPVAARALTLAERIERPKPRQRTPETAASRFLRDDVPLPSNRP